MNLFDLFEGAIDDLEARRIEDLEAKMDDLTARAKATNDPKVKEALRHEFAKHKAERDSYYKLNVEEEVDTNYTYTVFIDGTKEGTYDSKEEAKAVVKRKKEQAPGREYTIRPKSRTSMSSIKKFQRDRNRYVDEHGGRGVTPRQWHSYVKAHRTKEDKQDDLIKGEGFVSDIPLNKPPIDPAAKWKIAVRQLIADYIKNPRGLYNIAKLRGPNSPEAFAYNQIMRPTGKIELPSKKATVEASEDLAEVDRNTEATIRTLMAPGYSEGDTPGKLSGGALFYMISKKAPTMDKLLTRFNHDLNALLRSSSPQELKQAADELSAMLIAEGLVARGPSTPVDDKAVRKLVWDTLKINADTGEQAVQRALAYLAKKPQSRMVQDLQNKLQSLDDLLGQGMSEASMNWAAHKSTGPKFSGYLKGTDPAPTEFDNKSVGGMEEGVDGNMTVRSNPLSQPLRKRNYVAKNAQSSGAGKHNNNLKAAAARGQVKHKGKAFELDEMTDDEVAKIRKDAEALTTKQMTAPKKVEPKKSFMQKVGDKQIGMVKGAWKGLTGQLEESDNFLSWAVRNGYNFAKDPAIYESARTKYKALVESKKKTLKNTNPCWTGYKPVGTKEKNGKTVPNCVPANEDSGPIAPHETYYGAMDEAKGLGKRVRVVSGPAAGQTGTIGEIRNGAFKDAPKYYTVDLDNGSHVQVRKEALRLIKNELDESLRPGEYYVWTVYFDDGSHKRIKVNSDEFDPYAYYAKKNQVVVNVDYDWSIQQ